MHRPVRQDPGFADRRAEEGGLVVIAYTGRGEIFVEETLELVVRGHLVALPPFSCSRTHQRLPLAKESSTCMPTTALMRAKV
jgi:hypothetical protein